MVSGYYADDLKKLKEEVGKCDINTLSSLEYFLEQANSYTTGIPIDTNNSKMLS